MNYLIDFDFNEGEINQLQNSLSPELAEMVTFFPRIIGANYNYLKNIGISNIKVVFTNHTKMFLINPDRFKAIFVKYDQADLVRCLENNAAVIEKL